MKSFGKVSAAVEANLGGCNYKYTQQRQKNTSMNFICEAVKSEETVQQIFKNMPNLQGKTGTEL